MFCKIGHYLKSLAGAWEYVIDSFPVAVCDNIRVGRLAAESKINRDAAYTTYQLEDDFREVELIELMIYRKIILWEKTSHG